MGEQEVTMSSGEDKKVETFHLLTIGLNSAQRENRTQWVARFAAIVGQAPLSVHCEMDWIEGNFRQEIINILNRQDGPDDVMADVSEMLLKEPRWQPGERFPRLVVFCSSEHRLAKAIRNSSHAQWGAWNGGMISLIYEPQAVVTWH